MLGKRKKTCRNLVDKNVLPSLLWFRLDQASKFEAFFLGRSLCRLLHLFLFEKSIISSFFRISQEVKRGLLLSSRALIPLTSSSFCPIEAAILTTRIDTLRYSCITRSNTTCYLLLSLPPGGALLLVHRFRRLLFLSARQKQLVNKGVLLCFTFLLLKLSSRTRLAYSLLHDQNFSCIDSVDFLIFLHSKSCCIRARNRRSSLFLHHKVEHSCSFFLCTLLGWVYLLVHHFRRLLPLSVRQKAATSNSASRYLTFFTSRTFLHLQLGRIKIFTSRRHGDRLQALKCTMANLDVSLTV